jgi:hypothetical protein
VAALIALNADLANKLVDAHVVDYLFVHYGLFGGHAFLREHLLALVKPVGQIDSVLSISWLRNAAVKSDVMFWRLQLVKAKLRL